MQLILLERVENLGGIGDEVTVKRGYGRNFLIPEGKALLATDRNRKRFELERDLIEKRNAEARAAAETAGQELDGQVFVLIRQSGETGVLYGSVSARDLTDAAKAAGFKVERSQFRLKAPIKTIGLHGVEIRLHAEVTVTISANVARSEDEAERQAAGEDVLATLREEQRAIDDEQAGEMAEAAAELADQTVGEDDEA
ncbi:MAG: 50S ribosomal protein L9 [Pseudomonadota bacterium]